MLNLLKYISVLLFALGFVAGQKVKAPSSDIWWVAKSDNVLTWDCGQPNNQKSFTVLINQKTWAAPLAFIAIQQDSQCSKVISQNELNQPEGTYTILFANSLNISQVYVTSDEFQIKPFGSLYPSQVTPSAGSSASSPSTTANATGNTSGSISLKTGLGAVTLATFAIVTLFA